MVSCTARSLQRGIGPTICLPSRTVKLMQGSALPLKLACMARDIQGQSSIESYWHAPASTLNLDVHFAVRSLWACLEELAGQPIQLK